MKTILLFLVVIMAIAVAQEPQREKAKTSDILLLALTSPKDLKTGTEQSCILSITNRSQRLVLITTISFPDNMRMKKISLMQRVYGNIVKVSDKDVYCYNSMVQQESRQPFCYGVLLPGKRRTVSFSWLAFQKHERVMVHYIASKQAYDGSIASQAPLKLYMASAQNDFRLQYRPANKTMLQAFAEQFPLFGAHGAFTSGSHVFQPSLYRLPTSIVSCNVDFQQGIAFSADDAFNVAASMMDSDRFQLHYLPQNDCYLVEPNDKKQLCWLLHSPMQEGFGSFFPHQASVLIELLEKPLEIKLHVGDKQEGFGAGGKKAGYKFWDTWEVYYGDGMYTNGEFITVKKEQWYPLLEQIATKKGSIKKVFYYFQSYYYQLTLPKK